MASAKEIDARQRAYKQAFGGESGKEVLKDLAVFCGSQRSSYSSDALEMAFREGRREVFLRIQQHINISEDDIWKLYQREEESYE